MRMFTLGVVVLMLTTISPSGSDALTENTLHSIWMLPFSYATTSLPRRAPYNNNKRVRGILAAVLGRPGL